MHTVGCKHTLIVVSVDEYQYDRREGAVWRKVNKDSQGDLSTWWSDIINMDGYKDKKHLGLTTSTNPPQKAFVASL